MPASPTCPGRSRLTNSMSPEHQERDIPRQRDQQGRRRPARRRAVRHAVSFNAWRTNPTSSVRSWSASTCRRSCWATTTCTAGSPAVNVGASVASRAPTLRGRHRPSGPKQLRWTPVPTSWSARHRALPDHAAARRLQPRRQRRASAWHRLAADLDGSGCANGYSIVGSALRAGTGSNAPLFYMNSRGRNNSFGRQPGGAVHLRRRPDAAVDDQCAAAQGRHRQHLDDHRQLRPGSGQTRSRRSATVRPAVPAARARRTITVSASATATSSVLERWPTAR